VVDNQHDALFNPLDERLVQTNKLLLEYGDTQQVAHYWFKVGNEYTSNYWKQQFLIVYKTLLAQNSSSALIRISATVQDGNQKAAEDDLKAFAWLILPIIPNHLL